VAFRGEGRYVARLAPRRDVEGRTPRFVADGTYLVTGGLGGLGLIVAEWAARQGAGQLVLTGRRGLPPRDRWANLPNDSDAARQVAAIRMMEARGTRVEAISADVSNPEQMAALFSRFGKSLPPLRGIFHCAAVIEPRLLSAIDIESLTATLRPKLLGTWVLHHLTKEVDIDFLILFSSTTSLLGSTQLGHYAAANQFLDTFAHYRRNLGLPALSVNWGVWERMRLFSPVEQEATKRFGLKAMPAEKALEALGAVLGEDVCQITIASVDWRTLKPAYEARRARPFLKRVSERLPSEKTQPPRKRNPIIERIRLAPRRDQRELLMSYIREEVGMVLGIDSLQHIDPRQGFFEMGMDSLTSVELRARLEADLGKSLPKTLTFNYPNVEALTEYVAVQVLSFDDYSTSPIVLQGEREESQEPRMDVEHCSEDELVAMLADKLKRTSEESET
jgi:acyl carrier protein/NADP-dependent 3-hydroxy acid dehydrogenase YdfG